MNRLLVVALVLTVGLPAVAIAADRAASGTAQSARPYSTRQVLDAFATQGFTLQRQHVRPSARWVRLATRGSLHVIVFRRQRDATRTIEVRLGKRPHTHATKPGEIVIHIRVPRGSGEPHVNEMSFGNLAVVYLRTPRLRLGPRMNTALRTLRHS